MYIVYEITKSNLVSSYPTLENWLFGALKLTKSTDVDKYKYPEHDVGFDRKENFSFASQFGRNCIIFGADMIPCVHLNNKKNYILILGEGPTQGLDDITLNAEKKINQLYSM